MPDPPKLIVSTSNDSGMTLNTWISIPYAYGDIHRSLVSGLSLSRPHPIMEADCQDSAALINAAGEIEEVTAPCGQLHDALESASQSIPVTEEVQVDDE